MQMPVKIDGDSWLVLEYVPVGLFSLKGSMATSSVGKSLLVPTPYAIKMAIVNAAFRAGFEKKRCASLVEDLSRVDVRIAPPVQAVVTHTFIRIRQESRGKDPLRPYTSNIAYREMVHHRGVWKWAFRYEGQSDLMQEILKLGALVNYVGKRGSFIQFAGWWVTNELGPGFTQPLDTCTDWVVTTRCHIAQLDDFGPEASLDILSSYPSEKPKRVHVGKHRMFVETIVPVGVVNSGPGFTEYKG